MNLSSTNALASRRPSGVASRYSETATGTSIGSAALLDVVLVLEERRVEPQGIVDKRWRSWKGNFGTPECLDENALHQSETN